MKASDRQTILDAGTVVASPRTYFFSLLDGGEGHADAEGVELPDDQAASEYATRVAIELMQNREKQTRHWRIDVHNDEGRCVFALPFVAADRTLAHVNPMSMKLLAEMSDRQRELRMAINAARATVRRSRALVARCRGKPYLAAFNGNAV